MTEWEKGQQGYLYNANHDKEIYQSLMRCADLCWEFNQCRPSDTVRQSALLAKIIGRIQGEAVVTPPFYCDYGFNIELRDHFYANHNCTILDGAKVIFGQYVFIGPNCVFATAGHPLDSEQRNRGLEFARPITVGDNVWFGAGVLVLPGVTIGSNSVIAAGSVVNRDIPSGVIAAGNPCRVLRKITAADADKYPRYPEEQDAGQRA